MRLRYLVAAALAFALAIAAMSVSRASDPSSPESLEPADPAVSPRAMAVQTAADFLAAMDLETVLNDARRRETIRAAAAPQDRERLGRIYDAEKARIIRSYRRHPRFARAAFAGYRVDELTARSATIAIWAAAIGGSRNYQPASDWSTTVILLRRADDRWLVRDVEHQDGPSPRWPIRSLAAEASRFKAFHVTP